MAFEMRGGVTLAQAKKQKRELMAEIAKEHVRKDREKLRELRAKIRAAKAKRREAMRAAVEHCKIGRARAKQRARDHAQALRDQAREMIRKAIEEEKTAARTECESRKTEVRASGGSAEQKARQELGAERQLQRELARIEKGARAREREKPRATLAERRQESDDEVRSNLDPSMWPLWEKVKRKIKASDRMSRTEAFLHSVEEAPHELVEAQEELSQREIARLIREQRALEDAMRSPRRHKVTPAELADIPF